MLLTGHHVILCPVGHDGRQMYGREFLMQFKSNPLCQVKPVSLEFARDLLYDHSRVLPPPMMMGGGGGGGGGGMYGKNDRRVCQ